jgi:adenosylmethionine-8-amino-7-oxononanoate aminotransferase
VKTLRFLKKKIFLEENMEKSRILKEKVKNAMKDIPYVGEYRQLGMVGAIELVKDKETKEAFHWKDKSRI